MKNIKVGQVAEISDGDTVVVTRSGGGTIDLAYTEMGGTGPYKNTAPPAEFYNRPEAELVDMGNGRVIWNHEA